MEMIDERMKKLNYISYEKWEKREVSRIQQAEKKYDNLTKNNELKELQHDLLKIDLT